MLLAILVLFFRLLYGREPFCAADEHCLREWISSLGGWAAVFVAVPTVLYLSRQVADADKHHRQLVGLQLEKRLSIANGIITVMTAMESWISAWEEIAKSESSEHLHEKERISRLLGKAYDGQIIDEFNEHFYYAAIIDFRDIRDYFKKHHAAYDGRSTILNITERRRAPNFDVLRQFNKTCIDAAQDFKRHYNEILGVSDPR